MRTETPTPAAAVRLYKANLRVKDRPTYLRSLLRRTGRGPYLFPRALLAHLSEIDFYFPGAVSETDRQELHKLYATEDDAYEWLNQQPRLLSEGYKAYL